MDNKDIFTVSLSEVGKFVDVDLMDKIGDVLNGAKVKVATVHFTLAYMIADSIADANDPRDIAVSVMSLQTYILQIATDIYTHNRAKKAN